MAHATRMTRGIAERHDSAERNPAQRGALDPGPLDDVVELMHVLVESERGIQASIGAEVSGQRCT